MDVNCGAEGLRGQDWKQKAWLELVPRIQRDREILADINDSEEVKASNR